MPECQHTDYQGNNYVLRACSVCCKKYSVEVAKHGGIDVYANNVLTSQGSSERPRFLNEGETMGTETRRDPDPPRGLALTDLSEVPRRDRQQHVQDLTTGTTFMSEEHIRARQRMMNPPKAPPPGHWPEPSSRQLMNERILNSLRYQRNGS